MNLRESIGHQTAFALRLAKHVASGADGQGNVAFSPLSIHVVLALVAAGAKSQTLDQIVSALAGPKGAAADLNALATQIVSVVLADGSAAGGPRVSFANGIFVDASLTLKPGFREIVTGTLKSESKAVDFQTKAKEVAKEVNSWVENATTGLIKELLPSGSVDSSTRLVLGNALYFKGTWNEKFDSSETKDSEFHLLDGTSIQVPFMTTSKKQFVSSYDGFKVLRLPYKVPFMTTSKKQFVSSYEGFKVLRLPYKQGEDRRQFSMYIFLPDARDGLSSLQEKISSESDFLRHHLPMRKAAVGKFKLPKFKISFGFEASAVLKDLGLETLFSSDADLSEMVDSSVGSSLSVSSVHHKSFIEVNEEGTEAAAATAAVVALMAFPMPPVDFEADHPFLFFIREDMTEVLLFAGHVKNPLLAA